MGQYNTAVLTTAGQSLLTSILGTEGTLTFSKFQTSSYQYASGTDLSALTSLQSVEQEVSPSAGGVKDATTLYSSSTINNEGVTVEYDCNTVGLFATDGEDEVLFAVSTAIIPDVIPVDDGGAPSTYTYTMSIGVSSTANITVEVDDQGILRVSSIVDNLSSTSATAPLSANQGNVIAKDMVENILSGNTNTTGDVLATGSYFINNMGQLCRVTTDIPVDGAITLNTNCVAVNVGGELTELNSNKAGLGEIYNITINPSYASASTAAYLYRIGKINILYIVGLQNIPSDESAVTVGTLPNGIRPKYQVVSSNWFNSGGIACIVKTNGNIDIVGYVDSYGMYATLCVTFIDA
jgi:hypothetical protein